MVVSVLIVRSIRPLAGTAQMLAAAADELTSVAERLGAQASEAADKARALSQASDQIRGEHRRNWPRAAQGINASIERDRPHLAPAAGVATGAAETSRGHQRHGRRGCR